MNSDTNSSVANTVPRFLRKFWSRVFRTPLAPVSLAAALLSSCASSRVSPHSIMVSVADQKVALMENGRPVKVYKCSTSKFGVGDKPGSYATPLGKLKIADKIGSGRPAGTVFHGRQPTREILQPDAPGRDPIVSRILWLKGCETQNCKAYNRFIYIHGTPEERTIGRPASFGCIRMKSKDVIDLYNMVPLGLEVNVVPGRLNSEARQLARVEDAAATAAAAAVNVGEPVKILPPMAPKQRPGQSESSARMVAKNGKPRLGPTVAMNLKSKSLQQTP